MVVQQPSKLNTRVRFPPPAPTPESFTLATRVDPFLMFEGRAEEAMTFYVSLFPNSRVVELTRYGTDGPGAEGTIVSAIFEINGQRVMCSDSPIKHNFTFTPSASLFVSCENEVEFVRLAKALSENGQTLMPPDDYGFSKRFAWVNDRFGVSWQLNLA
jgi:predicted 3-demethylubiquinone-9 3-methyltransferase (glyoxalase superfamily)